MIPDVPAVIRNLVLIVLSMGTGCSGSPVPSVCLPKDISAGTFQCLGEEFIETANLSELEYGGEGYIEHHDSGFFDSGIYDVEGDRISTIALFRDKIFPRDIKSVLEKSIEAYGPDIKVRYWKSDSAVSYSWIWMLPHNGVAQFHITRFPFITFSGSSLTAAFYGLTPHEEKYIENIHGLSDWKSWKMDSLMLYE